MLSNKYYWVCFYLLGFAYCSGPVSNVKPPETKENIVRGVLLNQDQRRLAQIKTEIAHSVNMNDYVIEPAKIEFDKSRVTIITSRVKGRIEEVFIRENGTCLKAGQALYRIYSDELLAMEAEYITTRQQEKDGQYRINSASAARKLGLKGLTKTEIDDLNSKSPDGTVTFYSSSTGILTGVNVKDGDYIEEGDSLFVIADPQHFWVVAQVNVSEKKYFQIGSDVEIQQDDESGIIKGKVVFIEPRMRPENQTVSVRISLENSTTKFIPGAETTIRLHSNVVAGISVPVDAVIRSSKDNEIWIETASGMFIPRKVKIGIETFDGIEITEGASEGDRIVTSGAYLLHSEYLLQNSH